MPRAPETLECRCGSRSFKWELSGPMLKAGKVTGGTKILICATCDRKGERVVIF